MPVDPLRPDWAELWELSQAPRWITAQYDGRCRGCGDKWEPGDLIRFAEEEGSWVCVFCGQDP